MTRRADTLVPAGWQRCVLPEFTHIVMGQSPPSKTYNRSGDGLPFFQGKAEFGDLFPSINLYCSQPGKIAKQGATLLSVRAPVGPTNLAQRECCIGRGLAALHPRGGIKPKFLFYLLQSIEPELSGKGTGSTFKAITKGFLEGLEFSLPPLHEQRRIVKKIEEIFSELDKGVESLKTARAKLDFYRQAMLKHAFEGKLTAQWREENKHNLETSEQLLARIRQERETRYVQQLQKWKVTLKGWKEGGKLGKRPKRPPKLKKISDFSLTETEILPSLPAGWSYLRLGLVIDEPKYGSSKKCDYNFTGTGVLRIPNVVGGVVDTSDLKGAYFEENEKRDYGLRSGDILLIRSNGSVSIVGRCAIVTKAEEQFLYAGYLIRLRSSLFAMHPKYLAALLSSHLLRTQIEHKAKSTSGVNNINSGEIQSLIVPLCSLREQSVVVGLLSANLSSIDAIEREIDGELLKVDALRQSILKKAFSGELVMQNPDDELASVLLDRIRVESEKAARNNHSKKTKKRKTTE